MTHELRFRGPPSNMTDANLRRSHRFCYELQTHRGAHVCNGMTEVGRRKIRPCRNKPVLVDAIGDGWCGEHEGSAVVCSGCFAHVCDDRCVCPKETP